MIEAREGRVGNRRCELCCGCVGQRLEGTRNVPLNMKSLFLHEKSTGVCIGVVHAKYVKV